MNKTVEKICEQLAELNNIADRADFKTRCDIREVVNNIDKIIKGKIILDANEIRKTLSSGRVVKKRYGHLFCNISFRI